MRELSLFSGAGGGLLGSKLLGWTTVGYVEYEEYCQKVLRQRIADGILDAAPIFGDIRKFISEGYADAYQGMVDVVTGGFPCQPFSVAGKGLGEFDPRNMWPQTIEVIRRVRPAIAFLENVPGLLTDKYMGRIFGDLAEAGFDCKWDVFMASDVGAIHRRSRLWILAYAQGFGCKRSINGKDEGGSSRRQFAQIPVKGNPFSDQGNFRNEVRASEFIRTSNGLANRVYRIRSVGNGQVPLCMAYAFQKLSEGIIE